MIRPSGMPRSPLRRQTPLWPCWIACHTVSRVLPTDVIIPIPVMTIGSSCASRSFTVVRGWRTIVRSVDRSCLSQATCDKLPESGAESSRRKEWPLSECFNTKNQKNFPCVFFQMPKDREDKKPRKDFRAVLVEFSGRRYVDIGPAATFAVGPSCEAFGTPVFFRWVSCNYGKT